MLVSMSVPLSQNCSLYYLPTIANKFYFDQVTSASKEKCKYSAVSSISLYLNLFSDCVLAWM